MRYAKIERKTKETDILLEITLDSSEESSIQSGVPFLDHMIGALAKHGNMKVNLLCRGDTHIDDHHSVEDIGICMGRAFRDALGDKKGICRFGSAAIPLDEALTETVIDISGRPYFVYTGSPLEGRIGGYDAQLTTEFLYSFVANAAINCHVLQKYGVNLHHIHETIFKSLAVALRQAVLICGKGIPSTKGVLE